MNDPSLFAQLNACRDRSEELQSPECDSLRERLASDPHLREEFSRIQQWDQRIAVALQDVAVPAELCDRLLAVVGQPTVVQPTVVQPTVVQPTVVQPTVVQPTVVPPEKRGRRQRPIWLVLAGACAAVVAVGIFALRPPENQMISVCQTAVKWLGQLTESAWTGVQSAPRSDYPPSLSLSPRRWQTIATKFDSHTVVYDYAPAGAPPMLLFVSRERTLRLPENAPVQPHYSSGWNMAAWRHTDLVYVLAMQGSTRDYQRAVHGQRRLASTRSTITRPRA